MNEPTYPTNIQLQDRSPRAPFTLHSRFVDMNLPSALRPNDMKCKDAFERCQIDYNVVDTPFGLAAIAATENGVRELFFTTSLLAAKDYLDAKYNQAQIAQLPNKYTAALSAIFNNHPNNQAPIALDINPTPFQAIVWEALLSVPRGSVTSYKNIAELINQPKAARAVGTAIARNPIAFLIPCHRVIPLSSKTSAKLGGYRWGVNRKADMIKWEAANHN